MLAILNHISPFQPIPTPDFESIVKIQVCHFVDQQFQNNDGWIYGHSEFSCH